MTTLTPPSTGTSLVERPQRFQGRTALVTGAASGIGRATAERLRAEGATVILLDRDTTGLERLATAARTDDLPAVRAHRVDLLDDHSVTSTVDRVLAANPEVHVVVHSAGLVHIDGKQDSTFIDGGLAGWDSIFGVNLRGAALLTHRLLPAVLAGRGSIVTVSSEAAYRSRPNKWVYDASKAAVVSFTRSLAASLAPHGVRVNGVAPGGTITEMHLNDFADQQEARERLAGVTSSNLLGRLAQPHEIAAAIAFLASDDASFITGTTLAVDGGGEGSR